MKIYKAPFIISGILLIMSFTLYKEISFLKTTGLAVLLTMLYSSFLFYKSKSYGWIVTSLVILCIHNPVAPSLLFGALGPVSGIILMFMPRIIKKRAIQLSDNTDIES